MLILKLGENMQEQLLGVILESDVNIIRRLVHPLTYLKLIASLSDVLPDDKAKEKIAWETDKYWLTRKSKNSLKTIQLAAFLLRQKAKGNSAISAQGPEIIGKKQPSIIEAIVETVSRLTFLRTYTTHLKPPIISCISGGSMSYGRFFNVIW